MLAIFLASSIPPHCPTSSCMICAACFCSRFENSYLVTSLSPVAIGIEVCAATLAISSMFSGGTGSSNQKGLYCSSISAVLIALYVVSCP